MPSGPELIHELLFKDNPIPDRQNLIEQSNDDDSLGELEIEENTTSLIDKKAIADFNAHSNNSLLKSTVN